MLNSKNREVAAIVPSPRRVLARLAACRFWPLFAGIRLRTGDLLHPHWYNGGAIKEDNVLRLTMIGLLLAGGLGLAVQVAVNSRLRFAVHSPVLSALISFIVGGLLLLLVAVSGVLGRGRLGDFGSVPWWAWIGGLFGAFYVAMSIVALPRIGAALVIGAAVVGQLVGGLVIDNFGWLGVPKVPINPWRILGAVLLFLGVILMQRKG